MSSVSAIPDRIAAALSPELRSQLEQHLEELSRQGSVLKRRDRGVVSWRVRFRVRDGEGAGRQASIGLGQNEVLADAVRALLVHLKSQREERETVAQDARSQEEAARRAQMEEKLGLDRITRTGIQALAGGGRRHRAKVGRQYDKVMSGGTILEQWRFKLKYAFFPPPPPKRGRPRTARTQLW